MTNDQDVDRVREMTVGDLLGHCDRPPFADDNNNRRAMEKALALILERADEFYVCHEDDVRSQAVRIARLAVKGINKDTAQVIAKALGLLAHSMLSAEGAGEWYFHTLISLKKIRHTVPGLERRSDSAASMTPIPAQQPQA